MPLSIPPGVDPVLAAQVITFMKNNPEAAAAAAEQARKVISQNPSMAEAMLKAPSFTAKAGPEYAAALEKLADDEELGPVFKEIKEKGMEAMQRHWDDTELMEKIATKMRGLQVAVVQEPGTPKRDNGGVGEAGVDASSIKKPVSSSGAVSASADSGLNDGPDLHALAKAGDAKGIAAALGKRKSDGGDSDKKNADNKDDDKKGETSPSSSPSSSSSSRPDPNARDARGITPLGLAVGYNKLDVVEALLDGGALVDGADAKGSTPLHYASGYGRVELVKLLLKRGADVRARNDAGQTPLDVATVNREQKAVKALERALAEKESKEGLFV